MTNLEQKLAMPAAASGLAVAAYLLVRPYGDHSPDALTAAHALANPRWVMAHLFGALGIVEVARLTWRIHDAFETTTTHVLRALGLVAAVFTLPYYGAETFALHVIGREVLAHPDGGAFALVEQVRNQPAALVIFAVGLLALIATGIALPIAWRRLGGRVADVLPLGIAVALFTPQYFLPEPMRQAFGIAYLLCAGWFVAQVLRRSRPTREAPTAH